MQPPIFDSNWPEEVKALYRHDMQEIWDRSLAPHIWNQYHNQLDYYLAIAGKESKDILDVGCAQGTLALLLAERGHCVVAVDLRAAFLDYARSRHTHGEVRFLAANVLEDELPGRYDLIFANQIVEHLVYPEQLLRRLRARLHPGGKLVMTTPNGDYLKNDLPSFRELGDAKDWEHMQHSADGDGHFYAYRAPELVMLFEAAGFEEVKASCFESPLISGHMKVRHLHGFLPVWFLRSLDRVVINIPWLGRRLTHQLMVTGRCPAAP